MAHSPEAAEEQKRKPPSLQAANPKARELLTEVQRGRGKAASVRGRESCFQLGQPHPARSLSQSSALDLAPHPDLLTQYSHICGRSPGRALGTVHSAPLVISQAAALSNLLHLYA